MDFDWITERVLLGGYPSAPEHVARLQGEGVGHVLSVCAERNPARLFQGSGLSQDYIPVFEDDPAPLALRAAILAVESALLADAERGVYLHCWLGINRSATVMAGLLVRQEGCTVTEALDAIRRLRSGVVRRGPVVDALCTVLADDPDFARPERPADVRVLGRLLNPPDPLTE